MTEEWKSFTTSAGVELRYGPFPSNMYWDIQNNALEQHPDPDPPMKEIKTFDGTEEIEDVENEEYKAQLAAARLARFNLLGEASLEFCVEVVDWDRWREKLPRIARYTGTMPEDEDEQRVWFLAKYALRTRKDWDLIRLIQRFSQVEDEEVRRRVEFFRGDVEGDEDPGADAPEPAEGERVAVQREDA